MFPLFLAFLPLVSSILWLPDKDTTFVYSGNVICNMTAKYQVEMKLLEDDSITRNEVLHTVHLEGFNERPVSYSFNTSADDDGLLDDKKFELRFKVTHTCNSVDFVPATLQFLTDIIEIPVDGGVHSINVPDMDLTNRGDRV